MMNKLRFVLIVTALLASVSAQAQPPLCPHVLDWTGPIQSWANGAPWIKVIFANHIPTAQACGAQVFYRPYDTSIGTDDGDLPTNVTGTQYADAVWAKISGLAVKPQAIGYRNEFPWYGNAANRHTCAQFRSFRDRLLALGYTGRVVFGSFGVGWPDSAVWDEPEVADAASCADAIETHEYFDFDVNCMSPWLTFRHRDIAIGQHPALLGSKPWFIGEFGSDRVCNPAVECDDALCRSGWLDNGKLSESAYVTQLAAYRAGCHPNVVAVFVFQQGAPGWAAFETINSATVSNYMKSTWSATVGTISGWIRTASGTGIGGATVSTNPGGYTTTTDPNGDYALTSVNTGTYTVTASKAGYASSSSSASVTAGAVSTVNFTLTELDLTPPTIADIVPTPTWVAPNGTVTVTANVTDNKAISMSNIVLLQSTNLLTNPSFESGAAGWTNASSPAYSADNMYPAPTAKDGTHWIGTSCGYSGGIKAPELRQVVTVTPMTKYFVSVWVNTDGSPNPCSAFLQWKNGTVTGDGQCATVASTTSNTIGWQRLAALVTPTSSQLTVCLKLSWDCSGMGGGGNFDMAEVRRAITPSSYTGGVAAWNNVSVPSTYAFPVFARDTSGNTSLAVSLITVNVDSTVPSTPAVTDDGAYTTNRHQLHASWSAADPETGVSEYRYAIGTSEGGTDVLNWTSAGASTSMTREGLSLAYDSIYYISVRAKNTVGQWSAVGSSDGITIARSVLRISEAKQYADGSAVHLTDKVLSAKIGSAAWVQESDRSTGIRFNGVTSAALGSKLTVTGKLLTIDGERCIDEAVAQESGSPVLLETLYLRNGVLGGGSLNVHTPGIDLGFGTNNIGLLVTTIGRVTFSGNGFFYVDDGSGLNDGSGRLGVKVSAPGLTTPSTGFAKVTGISSCERNASGEIVRILRVRAQADITNIQTPAQ